MELPTKFSEISVTGDVITLSETANEAYFLIETKDTITESIFEVSPCDKPKEGPIHEDKKEVKIETERIEEIEIEVGKQIPITCSVS